MLYKAGLKLFDSNEVEVRYEFILGLNKIVVVEIHFTNKYKQKRKNKQTKKEKIKTKPILGLT